MLSQGAKEYLARNRHRSDLGEQDEEVLQRLLRRLSLKVSNGETTIPDDNWNEVSTEGRAGNNKISRVFVHPDYVIMLLQMAQWGGHFRGTEAFKASSLHGDIIGKHGGVQS